MNINLIGVPIKYGCDKDGVQFGPDRLRELGAVSIFQKDNHKIYDMGNIYVPQVLDQDKYKWHESMKYLDPIKDVNLNLAHSVYSTLKSQSFPFVIGGDHCIGIGSISGASRAFNEMAVIWVDAHGDINHFESSPSGNIHGMPLAVTMNVGHPDLTNLYYDGQKVKPENVYIVGARDLDPGEIKLAKDLSINLYTKEDINSKGLEETLAEVITKINQSKVDGVHFSFDIDVIDPTIMPGTGTPVANGMSLDEAKLILDKILNEKFVTSMDFVEFNPKLDNEERITEINCLELLEFISKKLD